MLIGITGNVGCGKSTVASMCEEYGFVVIDADKIGHVILLRDIVKEKIKSAFGDNVFSDDEVDRTKLGRVVFESQDELQKLNSIVHPIIISEIKEQISSLLSDGKEDIVIDAALLIEFGFHEEVNSVIVVTCSFETVVARNERFSEEELKRILNSQMSVEEKKKVADFVVENDGSEGELRDKIRDLVSSIS